jgi:hypothetical protein
MRSLGLSLSGLACVVALIVIAPKPANSQPSVLPLVSSASGVEEVGYYYRRYGYGYRRPYYGYGYGYRAHTSKYIHVVHYGRIRAAAIVVCTAV